MPDQMVIPSDKETISQFDGNSIVLPISSWKFPPHVRKNKIPMILGGAGMFFSPDCINDKY